MIGRIRTSIAATLVAVLIPTAPWAQGIESLNPKLVVVISIDQFSADLFAKWRGQSTGGLSFLAKQGLV